MSITERWPTGTRVRHTHPDWSDMVGEVIAAEVLGEGEYAIDAITVRWTEGRHQGHEDRYDAKFLERVV